MSNCHTNRSVKLPSFRHFQDRFLTTNKEKWGKKTALCFAGFVLLTFRRLLASHDSNPYPDRSRITRYNASKLFGFGAVCVHLAKPLFCRVSAAHRLWPQIPIRFQPPWCRVQILILDFLFSCISCLCLFFLNFPTSLFSFFCLWFRVCIKERLG